MEFRLGAENGLPWVEENSIKQKVLCVKIRKYWPIHDMT
jgi:hypothetical protein